MAVLTKKITAEQADQFAELYEQILTGDANAPSRYSSDGRAFNAWKKANAEQVSRIERVIRAGEGIAPTAFDEPYEAASLHGHKGGGSGYVRATGAIRQFQTATSLGAGWNPNVVGAPAPMIGGPIGRHVVTGVDIGFDALSWFEEDIIANPSCFVLGLPGLGKSTFIRKILMNHVGRGHIPIIAGDIKQEYVGFTQQVGGQVITLGPGIGTINPLDPGALGRIIPVLEDNIEHLRSIGKGDLINTITQRVHHQQVQLVAALVGMGRSGLVADWEVMLISAALTQMYATDTYDWDNPPLLSDLVAWLEQPTDALRNKARARTPEAWDARVDDLLLSLTALTDGATGQIFAGHTAPENQIDVNATAVCMDVSAVDKGDRAMKAAVVLSAWSAGFSTIEACNALADCGLAEQRYFAITLDEMWQTLAVGEGLVDRVDELTRLNRTEGAAVYEITHTSKDMEALPTEEDRKKAMGFIERAGVVACGGLPREELILLESKLSFSPEEARRVVSWSRGAAPKRSRTGTKRATPPGRGRFMLKAAKDGAPGIPLQTILTPTEVDLELHNTNKRFDHMFATSAAGHTPAAVPDTTVEREQATVAVATLDIPGASGGRHSADSADSADEGEQ
ncbi:ATP/GTP-binding protein [Corynebacterium kalidii]